MRWRTGSHIAGLEVQPPGMKRLLLAALSGSCCHSLLPIVDLWKVTVAVGQFAGPHHPFCDG